MDHVSRFQLGSCADRPLCLDLLPPTTNRSFPHHQPAIAPTPTINRSFPHHQPAIAPTPTTHRPMGQPRKRPRRGLPSSVDDPKGRPAESDQQEEDDETQSAAQTPTSTAASLEQTDEARLEHALRKYHNNSSAAYTSYHPTELSNQKDKFKQFCIAWKCKTNLLTHAGRCHAKHATQSRNRSLASVGVTGTGELDPQEVLQHCALWCAETASPFSALEQVSHQRLLHPTIIKNLPTRKMVSRAIQMIYLAIQEAFCQELKMHQGAMYLGVDAWQAPNGFDVIGAVIYRLKEDKSGQLQLNAMPLDFVKLKGSHTGKYLARMVQYIVEKFGIQNRICGIVSDNASNNAMMVTKLANLKWKHFQGEPQWIRCFAHILNLVVKAILQPFGPPKKRRSTVEEGGQSDGEEDKGDLIDSYEDADDGNSEEGEEEEDGDADCPEHKDGDLPEDDELTLEDIQDLEEEDKDDVYTSSLCRQTLAKFRAVATKLKKSPNSKAKFIKFCHDNKCITPHNIERDVPTRWNSTYKQIVSIIRCEKALIVWQRDTQYGIPRKSHLNQADFDLAQDLVQVLEPFYEFTLQVSTKASARVAHVVVLIDQITAALSTVVANEDERYPPALRNACRAGVIITNNYYSLTDSSPIYRIAMVLHPSFKDKYFKLAKWPKSWIDEAIDLTRDMYNTWYKPKQPTPATDEVSKRPPRPPQTGVLAGLGAAALARSAGATTDPIDVWLSGGLVLDEGAPVNSLKWWAEQKRGGNTHNWLLQMALNVMCCPATTVDVERTSNFGRDYVLARRHNLSAKSVSRGMAVSFFSKNNAIKPLALHEYMTKKKNAVKTRVKERVATGSGGVLTVED
ncbi:hypothetical protein PSTG_11293 [Puccinia striiformis f. sp. tritici PST-78]|uniref:HAT C-terminal dimerisation domain-containing protein n=1 Tax=Puccinia striiformis f. sp. tritici PST-78 TaxID=1165861 RepID=A0A0L0V810_9BASI|nr:hypothetical protein PSTG_11293 [Puccinia striiformis f. sp. tritici PST-78]